LNNTTHPLGQEEGAIRGAPFIPPAGDEAFVYFATVGGGIIPSPKLDKEVCVRTLATSKGVTIKDVMMDPTDPDMIRAVSGDFLALMHDQHAPVRFAGASASKDAG
jgi:hypothetical protein